MRPAILILICFSFNSLAQVQTNLIQLQPKDPFENFLIQNLYSDSNGTADIIWIRKEVKPHKHVSHSEYIYFLEGSGKMLIDDSVQVVNPGDIIFIPENTVHALKVTSAIPIKVISIHAPQYDGQDRIPIEREW